MKYLADIATAVKLTKEVSEARRRGYRVQTTWTKEVFPDKASKASYWPWTREHDIFVCTELNAPIWEVFRFFDEETRHVLTFTPENPEEPAGWIKRARFWQRALKLALPPDQYYSAMSSIWADYRRAMAASKAAQTAVAQ